MQDQYANIVSDYVNVISIFYDRIGHNDCWEAAARRSSSVTTTAGVLNTDSAPSTTYPLR
jgi:hypothetical protein